MTDIEMRVVAHSSGETDKKDPWFSVTFKGTGPEAEQFPEFKLSIKSETESIVKKYPIGKTVSLKLNEPQRKLAEVSK